MNRCVARGRRLSPFSTDVGQEIAAHLMEVGDEYNRTRLTPFWKALPERLMSWRR